MFHQRTLIGICAIGCVLLGGYFWLTGNTNGSISGILVRVGLMLFATWLAMPSLVKPDSQNSLVVVGVILLLIVVVAARPRIFLVVVGIAVVGIFVNLMLKKLSNA